MGFFVVDRQYADCCALLTGTFEASDKAGAFEAARRHDAEMGLVPTQARILTQDECQALREELNAAPTDAERLVVLDRYRQEHMYCP